MSGNGVEKIQGITTANTSAPATNSAPQNKANDDVQKYFAQLRAKKNGANPAPADPKPAEEKGFLGKLWDKAVDFGKTPVGKVLYAGGAIALAATVGKFIKPAAGLLKALGVGGALGILTSCSKDDPFGLGESVKEDIYHEHLVEPRIVTNIIEVPKIVHDTTYVDKIIHDTTYVEKIVRDTINNEVIVRDTIRVPEIVRDTIRIPEIVHDTIPEIITVRDTIKMKPDWHSPVNPLIDDAMDQFGVEQEGNGEFTLSFTTYDDHNSRLLHYKLNPQQSAQDGSTLRYETTVTNWDEEAGTITLGKNEEKSKADVSISETGQGLHIVQQGNNSVSTMDLEPEGNLYLVRNQAGEIVSPYEPTPLLKNDGFLQRGDFENSIKWTWPGEGVFGHYTNAKRTKSDAPVTGE